MYCVIFFIFIFLSYLFAWLMENHENGNNIDGAQKKKEKAGEKKQTNNHIKTIQKH